MKLAITALFFTVLGISPAAADEMRADEAVATFAGGCFWCMEPPYEELAGVKSVVSGYTGGAEENPTYKQVSAGKTGHAEAVRMTYDPAKITYEKLLDVFWRNIDPTTPNRQFVDEGRQYRTAIYFHDAEQEKLARKTKESLEKSGVFGAPIVTEILPAGAFYPAEDYHQDYYKKNPRRYKYYRSRSGRDQYLQKTWAGIDARDGSGRLTPLQYHVVKENGTEPPFKNAYWNHHEEGIYVDVVSGEPLFSSKDKFDSGTGWPSFTAPLEEGNIVLKKDHGGWRPRTEVRSKSADSHLGHVFNDGPPPTRKRYCINSAALRFVSAAKLSEAGYSQYESMFSTKAR